MSELKQLMKRIEVSGKNGIETAFIRDDYEPVGDLMIKELVGSDEFVSRRVTIGVGLDSEWKIYRKGSEPY